MHGGEKSNDGFVGFDVGHGFFRIGGVRINAEFTINKTFDACLKAIFKTIVASGDTVIKSAAG